MAAAMNHTIQTCQQLAVMTQTQMMDEDKVDPFPAKTTAELEEMLEGCRRTKEILTRESLIYSKSADFTKYDDRELLAMNAFVKESSRTLSIILAGGAQHFWQAHQVMSTLQELKTLYHYIDDKVKDFLLLDKIMDTLAFKIRYGQSGGQSPDRKNAGGSKNTLLSAHPDLNAFTAMDATKGASSEESLVRIAEVCEKFSVQCRAIAQTRAEKMVDRSRKVEVREKLLVEIDSVLPFLRQHVLRIGMHKNQLQDKDSTPNSPKKSNAGPGSPTKNNAGPGTHATKITSVFSHKAVEDAHKTVEDCRERLMQEQLFRRAKVERRLEQEEEMERMAASGQRQLSDMPAYASVLSSGQGKGKGKGRGRGSERGSVASRSASESPPRASKVSPARTQSPSGGTPRSRESSPRSPSPAATLSPSRISAVSPKAKAARASRAASPKLKAEQKGGTKKEVVKGGGADKKGGAEKKGAPKAASKAGNDSRESSPSKSSSPKARSRQK